MAAEQGARPAAAAMRCEDNSLFLSGVLNFDTVNDLDSTASAWFKGRPATTCTVDLGGVEYSNSAGIALLLNWLRLATADGGRLVLREVPEDMLAMAAVGGLSSLFDELGHGHVGRDHLSKD